ncbi:molybdenum transport protein ModC [Stutzerimonas degradans]|nr:molybdenum transport protein ModC [Stutzerimonas degradans]
MSGAQAIRACLRVDYADFRLDVDLALPGRGVTALFGHSGSGKTTLLRCVAGLERGARGQLEINGECWQDSTRGLFVPPHRRAIGYVFQDANLFAHLSVRRNLQFGMKRVAAAERRVAWDQAVDLLGIGHLLERMPGRLSGGERQRVGMARALLTSPRLLLMDEPLAALDLKRKHEILPYLERLHDELDIPVLYVSHSPDEVARLADHLVLLDQGRAIAQGELRETLARLDLPTAFSDDAGVVVEGEIAGHDPAYHLTRLVFPGGDGAGFATSAGHRPAPAFSRACARRQPGAGACRRQQHQQPAAGPRRGTGDGRYPGARAGAPGCRRHATAGAHHPAFGGPARRGSREGAVGADQNGGAAGLSPLRPPRAVGR